MKFTLLATALVLCTASASAQTIFTSVGPNGHKTFSDRAGMVPGTISTAAAELEVPNAPRKILHVSSLLSATVNAHEAERRLAQAQRKRSDGMALQSGEGDRIPGGIVVNDRYWIRQQGLDLEVEQAQRRSNETHRLQLLARQ
jgi:hypothetical protein